MIKQRSFYRRVHTHVNRMIKFKIFQVFDDQSTKKLKDIKDSLKRNCQRNEKHRKAKKR